MTKIFILVYFLLLMLDKVIIGDGRRLLLDFLVGQRNRKNAKEIHAQQTWKDRVTMDYILPMLKKNVDAFQKYHRLYKILLYTLLLQYGIIIAVHVFLPGIIWYVLGAFLAIKLLLAIFYTLELGPMKRSVYAQKEK